MPEYKIVVNEDGAKIHDLDGAELSNDVANVVMNMLTDRYTRPAYVYLCHNQDNHLYKIGRTTNLKDRMIQIRVYEKTKEISLIHAITCSTVEQSEQLEKRLHKRFTSNNIRGEWFALSQRDVDFLRGMLDFGIADCKLNPSIAKSYDLNQKYKWFRLVDKRLWQLRSVLPKTRDELEIIMRKNWDKGRAIHEAIIHAKKQSEN